MGPARKGRIATPGRTGGTNTPPWRVVVGLIVLREVVMGLAMVYCCPPPLTRPSGTLSPRGGEGGVCSGFFGFGFRLRASGFDALFGGTEEDLPGLEAGSGFPFEGAVHDLAHLVEPPIGAIDAALG